MTGFITATMNLDLQVHIENISSDGSLNTYTGIAWSRGAAMEKIEYSVDGGETWTEVVYESTNGTLSLYESFEFQFDVNTAYLPEGYNKVIVRGVDSTGASSMISWDTVLGDGEIEGMGSANSIGRMLFIGVVAIAILIFGAFVAINQRADEPDLVAIIDEDSKSIPEPEGILEATILADSSNEKST